MNVLEAARAAEGWPVAVVDLNDRAHKRRQDGRVACTGKKPEAGWVARGSVEALTRDVACPDCEWRRK